MDSKRIVWALLAAMPVVALAQAERMPPAREQTEEQAQTPIYGYQLMTEAERAEYRTKMRALKTQEERDAFRMEHHKLMQERAKEKGVMLPDTPPRPGMGQARQSAPGSGGQKTPPKGRGGPPQQ